MITERLYYDDAYLTEFEARVTAVRAEGWVALDRSAFYPTSGGQPFDTGWLRWAGGKARVEEVQVQDQVVWHRVDGPLQAGEPVQGSIDWPRRFEHMQQHAADHMLAGAAWQLFGGVTIGLHLGQESSTIDMELPGARTHLTMEETHALETLVNQRVQQDDPIRCWFPGEAELARLPLRKKPTVTEHVRVVAMGDYEMVACGGTHPRTTGQIGPIKILSCTPARGKMRLCFVAGMRAVRYFQLAAQSAQEMAAALSSDVAGAPQALAREREAALAARKEGAQRLQLAALHLLRSTERDGLFAGHLAFADHDTLLRAAGELTRDPQAVALLSCPRKEGRMLVFARGAEAPLDMAALIKASGARGGGKPDMAQGSAEDDGPLARAVEAVLAARAEKKPE